MPRGNYIPSVSEAYEEVDGREAVWRYMDFVKFVSLLSTNALYCNSLASFEDPYEGAAGLMEHREAYRADQKAQLMDCYRKRMRDGPAFLRKRMDSKREEYAPELSSEEFLELAANDEIDGEEELNLIVRKTTYVNCWYESDFESLAMWKLYSKDNENAISIKSSVNRLQAAVAGGNHDVQVGRVNYIDYGRPPEYFHDMEKCWFKSYHFAHENEIRLIPATRICEFDLDNPPAGILIPVDLTQLIEEVYVSPWAGSWLVDLVSDVCIRYGILLKVTQSEIAKKPFY